MEKPMKEEEVKTLWELLSDERKQAVVANVNQLAINRIHSGDFQMNLEYNFQLNLAFSNEEPIQYVYTEGILAVVPKNDGSGLNEIRSNIHFIEVSKKVDNFLDRKLQVDKEMKVMNGSVNQKPKDVNIDSILDMSESLQKEMHSMIDTIKETERGKNISYNDLQTIFFLSKISELQNQINNLKSNNN